MCYYRYEIESTYPPKQVAKDNLPNLIDRTIMYKFLGDDRSILCPPRPLTRGNPSGLQPCMCDAAQPPTILPGTSTWQDPNDFQLERILHRA